MEVNFQVKDEEVISIAINSISISVQMVVYLSLFYIMNYEGTSMFELAMWKLKLEASQVKHALS